MHNISKIQTENIGLGGGLKSGLPGIGQTRVATPNAVGPFFNSVDVTLNAYLTNNIKAAVFVTKCVYMMEK